MLTFIGNRFRVIQFPPFSSSSISSIFSLLSLAHTLCSLARPRKELIFTAFNRSLGAGFKRFCVFSFNLESSFKPY
ncbi:hypothetical protein AAHA92_08773 [Salvia divinorum]|uniref:Uncharacterized protein n=1 Tax=Salvia divinorum TaxID=28513 RepID=A0ABD1HPT2_SALDI